MSLRFGTAVSRGLARTSWRSYSQGRAVSDSRADSPQKALRTEKAAGVMSESLPPKVKASGLTSFPCEVKTGMPREAARQCVVASAAIWLRPDAGRRPLCPKTTGYRSPRSGKHLGERLACKKSSMRLTLLRSQRSRSKPCG